MGWLLFSLLRTCAKDGKELQEGMDVPFDPNKAFQLQGRQLPGSDPEWRLVTLSAKIVEGFKSEDEARQWLQDGGNTFEFNSETEFIALKGGRAMSKSALTCNFQFEDAQENKNTSAAPPASESDPE